MIPLIQKVSIGASRNNLLPWVYGLGLRIVQHPSILDAFLWSSILGTYRFNYLVGGRPDGSNVGALIIRSGFWGISYYNYKEPHKPYSNY